jgi:hypothetical protein
MSHARGFVAPDFEVVVAHYNENLSWLTPLASETIVYTKGMLCLHHVLRYSDGSMLLTVKERSKADLLNVSVRCRNIDRRVGQL